MTVHDVFAGERVKVESVTDLRDEVHIVDALNVNPESAVVGFREGLKAAGVDVKPFFDLIFREANGGDERIKLGLLTDVNRCARRCADFTRIDFFDESEIRSSSAWRGSKWIVQAHSAHIETVK